MKYAMKVVLNMVLVGICISYQKAHAENIKSMPKKQITVELDSLPFHDGPGDKPVTLNKNFLTKILPEVKTPRLMAFTDLGDTDEQNSFFEGGYTFVLRGDFNKDGFADIAFVGKYDNLDSPENNSFVTIISIKGKKVTREYFSKTDTPKAYLLTVLEYKQKIDAVGLIFNLYSEECGYLFWTGKQYDFEPCQAVF